MRTIWVVTTRDIGDEGAAQPKGASTQNAETAIANALAEVRQNLEEQLESEDAEDRDWAAKELLAHVDAANILSRFPMGFSTTDRSNRVEWTVSAVGLPD